MLELIALLDAASAPSRDLDHRIAFHQAPRAGCPFPTEAQWVAAATAQEWASPRYTSSIDAALTLGRSPAARIELLAGALRAITTRHDLATRRFPAADATFAVCREIILAALRATMDEPSA